VRKSPISCISKMWPFSLQIEDLLKDSKLRQFLRLIAKAISILFRDFVSLREISSKFRIMVQFDVPSPFYPKISDFGIKKERKTFFLYIFLSLKEIRENGTFSLL
jgi:hypothetical protein